MPIKTRGMKALKLLPNTDVHTHTHTQRTVLAGNFLSQYPVAYATAPRVPEASQFAFEVQQAASVLVHVADGEPELGIRREKGHPREISHRKQKGVQKHGHVERESTWHTHTVGHNFKNGIQSFISKN